MINALKFLFNKLICLHKWELLHREVTKSKIEQMVSLGARSDLVPQSMMTKTYIQTWSCNRCGKLKTFKDEM